MTFSLNLGNIADAISNISVPGVTVRDKDEIAASWVSVPNVLFPNTENDGWITEFNLDYKALPRGGSAPVNVMYTLRYRFLGTQVGSIATFPDSYNDLVKKVIAIINAMVAVHDPYSGSVNMEVTSISLGPRTDPAGNNYFGADISLSIEEIQN
jgi:hypothetical protein